MKGTNFASIGMWNIEDAQKVEENLGNYKKLEQECKNVIYNRIVKSPKIKVLLFYTIKLASQWCIGDFGGSLWTQKDIPDANVILKVSQTGSAVFQLFYIVLLICIFKSLNQKTFSKMILFYVIFVGYVLLYLITENQARYGYIVSWLFVLMSCDEIYLYFKKLNKFFR